MNIGFIKSTYIVKFKFRCHKLLRLVGVASTRYSDLSVRVRQTLSSVFHCTRAPYYIFQSPNAF